MYLVITLLPLHHPKPESDHGYYSILDWKGEGFAINGEDLSIQQRAYVNGKMDNIINILSEILENESLANHCDIFDDDKEEEV